MELIDERHAGKNECGSHDERADDTPEQHPVLVLTWHPEIGEQHQENEQVVHAQRQLNQVASDKLKRRLPTAPEKHQHGKATG